MMPVETVLIGVTYACQCDCVHCGAALSRDPRRSELTTDEIKDVIAQCMAIHAASIGFFGGEPLLRADIQTLIACAHSRGLCTNLDTNGALLTQARVQGLKAAGLDIIGVSLDSPVAERHDALRRMKGIFSRAVNGIRYCLDAGIHCYVSTYASHESVADGSLRTLIDLSKELGVGWIRVCAPFAAGKWIAATEKRLTPDERRIVERIAEEDPDFVVLEDLNGCPGVQRRLLYISAYGDVQPCCYVPIGFGNIRQDCLTDIVDRIDDHPMYARYGQLKHCPMNDDAFRSEFIRPSLPILQ